MELLGKVVFYFSIVGLFFGVVRTFFRYETLDEMSFLYQMTMQLGLLTQYICFFAVYNIETPANLNAFLGSLFKYFIGTQKVLKWHYISAYGGDYFFRQRFYQNKFAKFGDNDIFQYLIVNFILIMFIQAGFILLYGLHQLIYFSLKRRATWSDSYTMKFFKYWNRIWKYELLFSIFLIFTVEEIVFSFYNLSINFNVHFEHFLFFLSFLFSLLYICGLFFLIIMLFVASNEENVFYKVFRKFFFVSRGVIKKFPQNKFLLLSLMFYFVYGILMVVAYTGGNVQTVFTTVTCGLFLIYLLLSLPPDIPFYKFFLCFIFTLLLTCHILFSILSFNEGMSRGRREDIGLAIAILCSIILIGIALAIFIDFVRELLMLCYYRKINV